MWKHMMQAAEEFIVGSLFQHSFSSGGHNGFASRTRPVRSVSPARWGETAPSLRLGSINILTPIHVHNSPP